MSKLTPDEINQRRQNQEKIQCIREQTDNLKQQPNRNASSSTSPSKTVEDGDTAPLPISDKTASTEMADQPELMGEIILTEAEHPTPARLGAQVKLDIGRISGQVSDSGLRSLVAGYQRPVSPTFKGDGDAHFPRSMRRHATHKHRSGMDGFGNVLLHHIGDAVLAYYNIENGVGTQADLDAIDQLHRVAMEGASTFDVAGAANLGFYLAPRSKG